MKTATVLPYFLEKDKIYWFSVQEVIEYQALGKTHFYINNYALPFIYSPNGASIRMLLSGNIYSTSYFRDKNQDNLLKIAEFENIQIKNYQNSKVSVRDFNFYDNAKLEGLNEIYVNKKDRILSKALITSPENKIFVKTEFLPKIAEIFSKIERKLISTNFEQQNKVSPTLNNIQKL